MTFIINFVTNSIITNPNCDRHREEIKKVTILRHQEGDRLTP
ncbi:hypothetical protein [Fischerella sp. NIES-3754]|nr:hypothetical protein [Fischerella sp. NIES-3754]